MTLRGQEDSGNQYAGLCHVTSCVFHKVFPSLSRNLFIACLQSHLKAARIEAKQISFHEI